MAETYVSVDVETDGPVPGVNSMLSLGAVAFDAAGAMLGVFDENLERLPGAKQDPGTMKWWNTQPEAFATATSRPKDPSEVMRKFVKWLEGIRVTYKGRLVFVGYPASFDFMFVHWYLVRLTKKTPFGHQALDLKTYAMAALCKEFKETHKGSMPKEWFSESGAHSHVAVQDAMEQGQMFFRMRASVLRRRQEEEHLEARIEELEKKLRALARGSDEATRQILDLPRGIQDKHGGAQDGPIDEEVDAL